MTFPRVRSVLVSFLVRSILFGLPVVLFRLQSGTDLVEWSVPQNKSLYSKSLFLSPRPFSVFLSLLSM